MGPGVEQQAAGKIVATLRGESAQPRDVGERGRGGGLDFNAPGAAATGDHQVDLDLVFVAVVPETQLGISPAGLGAELLQHECFEQVAKTIAAIMPVFCGEFGERGGQTAVEEMHLRRLDEPL